MTQKVNTSTRRLGSRRSEPEEPDPGNAVDAYGAYARSYPHPSLVGLSQDERTKAIGLRLAAQGVVNRMVLSTDRLSRDMRTYIEMKESTVQKIDTAKWPGSYNAMWKFPAYFLARCMETYSSKCMLFATLDEIEDRHPGSLRKFHVAISAIEEDDYMPRTLLDKDMTARTLIQRVSTMGFKWEDYWEEAFDGEGDPDWQMAGPYEYNYNEEGLLVSVIHHTPCTLR